jgi:hypothetical protein
MRFLLRMAFWLGVVLVLLPSGSSQPTPKVDVGAVEAVSAARATVSDMRQFCERQPDACQIGSQAATVLGQRAQAGAKLLYEFLNEQFGPNDTGAIARPSSDPGKTVPLPVTRPSQHTLAPTDLGPAWRSAQPRRDASERAEPKPATH